MNAPHFGNFFQGHRKRRFLLFFVIDFGSTRVAAIQAIILTEFELLYKKERTETVKDFAHSLPTSTQLVRYSS
jgi:hypothetical protein